MNKNAIHTLSHTTWNCKYHIVCAEIQKTGILWREKSRDRENPARIMQVEGSQSVRYNHSSIYRYAHKIRHARVAT